jgi:hypothetical protein
MGKAKRKAELEARVKNIELQLDILLDEAFYNPNMAADLPPANTAANFGTPNGVTASYQSSDGTWRSFETFTFPPSVPREVATDYGFFLRFSGLADSPDLRRAFLAGRLTA